MDSDETFDWDAPIFSHDPGEIWSAPEQPAVDLNLLAEQVAHRVADILDRREAHRKPVV